MTNALFLADRVDGGGVISVSLLDIGAIYPSDDVFYVAGIPCHISTARRILASQDTGGGEEIKIMVASATAHRACHNQEQDVNNGKLGGYCIVCGVPWPCETAQTYLASRSPEAERGWRKWPEEKPITEKWYLTQTSEGGYALSLYRNGQFYTHTLLMKEETIIAFQELPAPYTPSTKKGDDNAE